MYSLVLGSESEQKLCLVDDRLYVRDLLRRRNHVVGTQLCFCRYVEFKMFDFLDVEPSLHYVKIYAPS